MKEALREIGRALAALLHQHEIVSGLVRRNLRVKYQSSALGFVWTLLNPILTLSVLFVVFTHVIRIPIPHYWAFLLSGYFAWLFLTHAVSWATLAYETHARLVRGAPLPLEAPLVAGVLSRLAEFAIELGLVAVLLAVAHHHALPTSFALVPFLALLEVVLVLGIAYVIAALSVYYEDAKHLVPIALTALFYASPVFYSAAMAPPGLRWLYALNPVALLLGLYQAALYEGVWPGADALLGTIVYCAALYLAGHAIFNRAKVFFAELL